MPTSPRCGTSWTIWSRDCTGFAQPRYRGCVQRAGGLKLKLEPATRGDRRTRFAEVRLSAGADENDRLLVTDSAGRMRFRLPDGDYRLRVLDGQERRFAVRDQRWTTVRLRLTQCAESPQHTS